jgi:3-hydroxyisobutyrate dehydrogenase
MTIQTIAFIGVGNMGSRMARCLHRAKYKLIICDQDPEILNEFQTEGCQVTRRASDCAQADLVIVMVADDNQVIAVTTGTEGVVAGLDNRHHPLVCIMSTALPETIQKIGKLLGSHGVGVVDAPVSGGLVKAAQGTLTIMISGSSSDIDQVEPVMKAMGTSIFRCGELGAAEVVKVINNMLGIANIYLAAEALQLAARYDVNLRQLIPILEVSSGRNFMTQDADLTSEQYQAWARSPEAFMSLKNIVSKDLHLAQDLAQRSGLKLELLDDVSARVDATTHEVMKTWNDVALRLDSDSERGKAKQT